MSQRERRRPAVTSGPGVVGLFADWRAATGRPSDIPADEADLEAFFADLPAATSTRSRRRRELEAAGVAPPRPHPDAASRDMSDLCTALRAIPVGGWLDGLVGRRDAALLALSLAGGLRRPQLRELVVGGGLPDLPVLDAHPSVCPGVRSQPLGAHRAGRRGRRLGRGAPPARRAGGRGGVRHRRARVHPGAAGPPLPDPSGPLAVRGRPLRVDRREPSAVGQGDQCDRYRPPGCRGPAGSRRHPCGGPRASVGARPHLAGDDQVAARHLS